MRKQIVSQSQIDYKNLLKQHENLIFSDSFSQKNACMMLDDVYSFWCNIKDSIALEVSQMTQEKESVIFSCGIYLDAFDDEHYYFKALGERHIVSDPLLRLEPMFRIPCHVFSMESIQVFRRAYRDAIYILENCAEEIYILPIDMIVMRTMEEKRELMEELYLNFLNSLFDSKCVSKQEFLKKYSTLDDIARDMPEILDSFIGLCIDTEKMPSKEKLQHFIALRGNPKILEAKADAEVFLNALFGIFASVAHALIVSSTIKAIPFVRNHESFALMMILKDPFLKEVENEILKKSFIFYRFHNIIKKDDLRKIPFFQFVQIVKQKNILETIIQKLGGDSVDIFESNPKDIDRVIMSEFIFLKKTF